MAKAGESVNRVGRQVAPPITTKPVHLGQTPLAVINQQLTEVKAGDLLARPWTKGDLVVADQTGRLNNLALPKEPLGQMLVRDADTGLPAWLLIFPGDYTITGSLVVGSDTDQVKIDAGGDMVFTGGAGLVFGEIYVKDNLGLTTLNSAAKVQVDVFDTDGVSNNTTPDHTNDHITITKAGKYLVTVSLTVENSAAQTHKIDLSVWINNGATEKVNVHAHRTLTGGSGDVGSMSLSGIVDFAEGDTVEVWADTDAAADRAVIFEDCTLSIVQVGG